MSTHNMPFINIRKENDLQLQQICMGGEFFPRDSRTSS